MNSIDVKLKDFISLPIFVISTPSIHFSKFAVILYDIRNMFQITLPVYSYYVIINSRFTVKNNFLYASPITHSYS